MSNVPDLWRRMYALERALDYALKALDQADADARCHYTQLAKQEMPQ